MANTLREVPLTLDNAIAYTMRVANVSRSDIIHAAHGTDLGVDVVNVEFAFRGGREVMVVWVCGCGCGELYGEW